MRVIAEVSRPARRWSSISDATMRFVGSKGSVEGESLDLWEDSWLYTTGFVLRVEVDHSLGVWENDSAALHMERQWDSRYFVAISVPGRR